MKLSGGTLTPAYGRDYKSRKEAIEDFKKGKDFIIHTLSGDSTYCSIRDFEPGSSVQIRFQKMRKVAITQVPKTEDSK